MTNELQTQLASLPAAFSKGAAAVFNQEEFESGAEGIEGGYGLLKFRGKTWTLHYKGKVFPFMRADGDGPRNSLDLIVVRAATHKSKTYYQSWQEGSRDRPDCSSMDAIRPDAFVVNPPADNCTLCPMNKIGSRTNDAGKATKACTDYKRLAVVIDPTLAQEALGMTLAEPILLRIPAASLTEFSRFSERMEQQKFPLPSFIARVSFDPSVAYPRLVFTEVRPLNPQEAKVSLALRNDPLAYRITGEVSDKAISYQPEQAADNRIVPVGVGQTNGAAVEQKVAQQAVQSQPVDYPTPPATSAELDAKVLALMGTT